MYRLELARIEASVNQREVDRKLREEQMEVDRKLREELRWDCLTLRLEFWKLLYGKSQAHNVFIPKRFEDLKLNGGIRLRKIPIKLIYHKARFKKRKRRLMREKRDPWVTHQQTLCDWV